MYSVTYYKELCKLNVGYKNKDRRKVSLIWSALDPLNIIHSINFCQTPYDNNITDASNIAVSPTEIISEKMSLKRSSRLCKPTFGSDSVALLQMESRLFDNGQIEKRPRFPYVERLNCAHGKYLHFKGLLRVCIMFDTGARTSLADGDCYKYHKRMLLVRSRIPIPHTNCAVMSYSRLKQVHTRLTAHEPTAKFQSSAMHYRTPCALAIKWIFLNSMNSESSLNCWTNE